MEKSDEFWKLEKITIFILFWAVLRAIFIIFWFLGKNGPKMRQTFKLQQSIEKRVFLQVQVPLKTVIPLFKAIKQLIIHLLYLTMSFVISISH